MQTKERVAKARGILNKELAVLAKDFDPSNPLAIFSNPALGRIALAGLELFGGVIIDVVVEVGKACPIPTPSPS